MQILGILCFVVGVAALAALVIRRGRSTPLRWPDYLMIFVGLAGALGGLAIMFVRAT
jgi:hypothetical protein